jgi:hypothetical protein
MKARLLRRFAKFAILVVLGAMVLTGAARVGVSRYLASARGKALVSDRLGTAIGMPVEVSEFDVGGDRASFRFRVMDPGDPHSEVLNVPAASADVSASDLMTGRVSPSALNFNGASLTLRVNADGQVTTPLPALPGTNGSFPAVAIDNGRVCVRQEGRPDFAVSGVTLRLTPAAQKVTLSGSVSDPDWGEWTIRGELRRDNRTGWVELTSADAPLDPELLATIPFAPPELFDNVQVSGRTAVKIRLTLGANRDVQPAVEIGPALQLFGTSLGRTYRLYTNGTDAHFEK